MMKKAWVMLAVCLLVAVISGGSVWYVTTPAADPFASWEGGGGMPFGTAGGYGLAGGGLGGLSPEAVNRLSPEDLTFKLWEEEPSLTERVIGKVWGKAETTTASPGWFDGFWGKLKLVFWLIVLGLAAFIALCVLGTINRMLGKG
jgi:hypothetical protein